jgi:hypothetical protein
VESEDPDRLALDAGVREQLQSFLQHPSLAQLLLQNLASCTALLHQHHVAYTRAQRRQRQQQQQPSKQHRADLLPIPAYHQSQDMLQLLPGGQAYLDAAAASFNTVNSGCRASQGCLEAQKHAKNCCYALSSIMMSGCFTEADQQQASVLSAAAVRVVLELQLLAAAEHQRSQQEDAAAEGTTVAADLLHRSTQLLHILIRAVAQASGSCLPPEVLQQAGLQLLQALAAPLQQVQLSSKGHLRERAEAESIDGMNGGMGEACHVLVTAACGPAVALSTRGE